MTPKKPKREKGAPGTRKRTKPKRKKAPPQLALFAPRQENLFDDAQEFGRKFEALGRVDAQEAK